MKVIFNDNIDLLISILLISYFSLLLLAAPCANDLSTNSGMHYRIVAWYTASLYARGKYLTFSLIFMIIIFLINSN
jgi:hypothetical protein